MYWAVGIVCYSCWAVSLQNLNKFNIFSVLQKAEGRNPSNFKNSLKKAAMRILLQANRVGTNCVGNLIVFACEKADLGIFCLLHRHHQKDLFSTFFTYCSILARLKLISIPN